MSVVLDTMVFVYASLDLGPMSDDSRRAMEIADDLTEPDFLFAEIAEATRRWVAAGVTSAADALATLEDSRSVVRRRVDTMDVAERALDLAVERGHSVYDCLFVAVADLHGTRVVTYDRRLLGKFPEWTVSVPEFVRARG